MGVLAAILVAWALFAGAFIGIGLCLSGLAYPKPKRANDYLDAFWRGFAATVALLQVWHVWFPVNAWLALGVALLGWFGLLRRLTWSDVMCSPRRQVLVAAGALVSGAAWLALMGLRPLEIYDAGLYHLQAIAWDATYPSVAGLGNLQGRLAFNSSYFLVLAMLSQGPLAGEAYRAGAGLIVLALFAQIGLSIVHIVRSHQASSAEWLLVLMALPTAAVVGSNGLATTSTDLPIFMLQVVIAYQLLRWLTHLEARESRQYLGNAAVLAAASVTIKLSSGGFAAGCAGLVLCVALSQNRARATLLSSPLRLAFGLSAVLLMGMVANSVIVSGYPFYPSTALPLPVSWRVPEGQARLDTAGIVLFARQPGPLAARTYSDWAWLPDWIGANAGDLAPPIVAAVLGLLLAARRWTGTASRQHGGLVLLAPVWAALALWFVTAPALRFAGALFWLAGAIPVAVLQTRGRSRSANLALVAFTLVSVLPPQTEQLSLMLRAPVAALRRGITPIPVAAMTTFVTDSGLRLYVPADTELAWAGPLPSTPTPDRRLRLRCPDNLACGFILDGAR